MYDGQKQSFFNGIFTVWASKTTHTVRIYHKRGIKRTHSNDQACVSCGGLYSDDTKTKNGAEWIKYTFCQV